MSLSNILVIGCGSIGQRHARCFLRTGRVELTVCDTDQAVAERVGMALGVPFVTDWEQAVKSGRFDATAICTPAHLHVSMGLSTLQAGAHTLIEKPLSCSIQDVDQLVKERDRSGLQAGVAYVYKFFPYLAAVQAYLRSNVEEPVLLASYVGGQPFHLLRPAYAQTYYRDRRTGGGAIQDALTHIANWVEGILGPTESVLCDCEHLALPNVKVEDTVNLAARHDGALAIYSLNQFQSVDESIVYLHTASTSVKVELHRERWGHRSRGDTDWIWHESHVPDYDVCFIAQANAFLDRIDGKPSELCTLEAAIQTLRFNLSALASSETGRRIYCRELTPC